MSSWFDFDDSQMYQTFKERESVGHLDLMNNFQLAKHKIGKFDEGGVAITIPASFLEHFEGKKQIVKICQKKRETSSVILEASSHCQHLLSRKCTWI
eukprot:TRINITY_DN6177_c0_g1_i1.p2 TRINITY_DN6177_c0_g1~~TRINITY_DN6177_c0_g1_i1.p2  ORF type:complete len:97 (-),score=20.07 TRINITY_DN6177_c0_g1_i1:781-1071(-)